MKKLDKKWRSAKFREYTAAVRELLWTDGWTGERIKWIPTQNKMSAEKNTFDSFVWTKQQMWAVTFAKQGT